MPHLLRARQPCSWTRKCRRWWSCSRRPQPPSARCVASAPAHLCEAGLGKHGARWRPRHGRNYSNKRWAIEPDGIKGRHGLPARNKAPMQLAANIALARAHHQPSCGQLATRAHRWSPNSRDHMLICRHHPRLTTRVWCASQHSQTQLWDHQQQAGGAAPLNPP